MPSKVEDNAWCSSGAYFEYINLLGSVYILQGYFCFSYSWFEVNISSCIFFFPPVKMFWLQHGDHLVFRNFQKPTASKNFVSQQFFIHVQLSCHFKLVSHFEDKYPHIFVPLHLTCSDSYGKKIYKIRGMVGFERTYNFHELVGSTNTLNQLASIEYGENRL